MAVREEEKELEREREEERERKCRRGIAAVLAAYRYKDDDDLQTNLDFLENLKKRMMEEKTKFKIKITFKNKGKSISLSSNITTDCYNFRGNYKRMLETEKVMNTDQKFFLKNKKPICKDKGKSVIITEECEDHEQAGCSSGRRVTFKNKRPRPYYDSVDDYNCSTDDRRNKRRNIEKQSSGVNVNLDYLNRFVKYNDGSNMELVIEKELTATDVAKNNGRLAMPFRRVKTLEFLTEEEKGVLDWGQEEMDISFFDPNMREVEGMKLRQWNMNSSKGYVLRTKWNQVVRENGLEPGMPIQLWSFRIQQRLCFALLLS